MPDTPEDWMTSFPDHPIFAPPQPQPQPASPGLVAAILNQNHIVVAHAHELRIASLAKFKSPPPAGTPEPAFKILKPITPSTLPEPPITHLVPNPNSRLLALGSHSHLSVISLPRLDKHPKPHPALECETLSIGQTCQFASCCLEH